MTTALRTLLTGIPENSFKRLSLSTESTALANALPRTKANFDGNGSTWTNDAAVTSGPMAGVGAATNATDVMFAFSGAGIHDSGKAALQGGGHTDSGDGSVYTFDPEAASANINTGGSGIAWAMSLKSCRYIDAFTNLRPSAVNSPAGNQEDAPTTPAGANAGYWLWPSADGVNMPGAGHTYHFNRFLPGTNKMLISQWGSMDPNQGASPNAGYVYDIVANTMTGPLITTAGMPANGGVTVYGYVQDNGGSATTMGVGSDGCAYSIATENFADRLYQWTNPTTSALALIDTGAFSNTKQVNRQQAAALLLPDPANPGQLIYFQHSYNPGDGGSDANFMVVTGLNGGTPTMTFHNYASGTVATDGLGLIDYDYDTVRKKIIFTDGQHLFTVTPDLGGNLDAWVIAQIASFTGDTPPDASLSGNEPFPSLRYLTAEDCYAHVYSGGYRVYKPVAWSPPATGTFPWIFWGLDAWSLIPTGGETISGSVNLASLSLASALKLIDKVSGSVALPILTLSSSIKLIDKISGNLALASAALSSSLRHLATISGSVALPILTLSSSIKLIGKISGTVALPPLTLASSLKLIDKISGSVALPILTISSSLTVGGTAHITGSLALPSVALTSALKDIAKISGTVALPVLTLSSLISTGNPSATIPDSGFIVNTGRLMNR